jgi:uncharacterized protein YndB with AHSA1/START domain
MDSITTPATIDSESYTISRTVFIEAPRDAVWATLTKPEHIVEWFGQRASFDKLAAGGTGSFGFDGYGDFPVLITRYDEPEYFSYRWGQEGKPIDDATSTLVSYTLTEVDGGTLLSAVESGFDLLEGGEEHRRVRLEENRGGWDSELDKLKALLESRG